MREKLYIKEKMMNTMDEEQMIQELMFLEKRLEAIFNDNRGQQESARQQLSQEVTLLREVLQQQVITNRLLHAILKK